MTDIQKRQRPAPFSLRLTEDERTAMESKAGRIPLGAYIKSVILEEDAPRYRQRRTMPEADQRMLAEILARLGASRSANNLNQIAKHLNQGSLVIDDQLEADLRQAIFEVAWMRTTLMNALGVESGEKP